MKNSASSASSETPTDLDASITDPAPKAKASMKPKLLIVDDDEEIRTQMRWALASDYTVSLAGDRAVAVEQFRTGRPQVVLLDLGLPPNPGTPEEGLATLSEILTIDRSTKVVIVSGQGEKGPALRAIGTGAYDFLGKPVPATRDGDAWVVQLPLTERSYIWQWRVDGAAPNDEATLAAVTGPPDPNARAGVRWVKPLQRVTEAYPR